MFFNKTAKKIKRSVSIGLIVSIVCVLLFVPACIFAENTTEIQSQNESDAEQTEQNTTAQPTAESTVLTEPSPTSNELQINSTAADDIPQYTFSVIDDNASPSTPAENVIMRVKLSVGSVSTLTFTANGTYKLNENGSVISAGTYTITASGSKISLSGNGVSYSGTSVTLIAISDSSSIVQNRTYNGSSKSCTYLGDMVYTSSNSTVTVINHISIEKYLYGVVSNEMSNSWPLEALKAQAVCARGYAMNKISSTKAYDLTDTSTDQVYYGYNPSYKNVINAVDGTAGRVAKYNDKIITAFYSASNGGQTELPGNAWGGGETDNKRYPYLVQKDDKYDLENTASSVQITNVPSDPSGLLAKKTVKIVNCNTSCNVRNKPTTSGSTVIGQAPKNATYIMVGITNGWYEVLYTKADGSTVNAFISGEFIEEVTVGSGLYVYSNPAISDIQNQAYNYCKNTLKYSIYDNKATSIRIDKINSLVNGTERWPGTGSRSYVTAIANITVSCFKDSNGTLAGQKTFNVSIALMNTGSSGYVIAHDYLSSSLRLRGVESAANGWNIVCRRFGHGVGMSQRGAQTMASAYSLKYTDIISFYFPGTVLSGDSSEQNQGITGNIVTGIKENTTADDFIKNIKAQKTEFSTVTLTDKSGSVKTSGVVCNGDVVSLNNSTGTTESYTVIMYGDVNCDGAIDLFDLLSVQKVILEVKTIEGPSINAADISKDSTIDILDLLKLQKHLLGSAPIAQ